MNARILVALCGTLVGCGIACAQDGSSAPVTPAGQSAGRAEGTASERFSQPGAEEGQPEGLSQTPEGDITLAAFSEPIELSALIEYVVEMLQINVSVPPDLSGSVMLNAPVTVKKSNLLEFLDAMLEQRGYTITQDRAGFFTVRGVGDVPMNLGGDLPTTRIISTPNARPSSLRDAISTLFSGAGPGLGGGAPGGAKIAYVDDLGIIVATDTPRRLRALEELVTRILGEQSKMQFIRLDLKHIAAPVARQRAIELVGQAGGGGFDPVRAAAAAAQGQAQSASSSINNLTDRLTVDPQGNTLIFRGLPPEIELVKTVLATIDLPSTLEPRRYFTGSVTRDIANFATKRGLGELVQLSGQETSEDAFARAQLQLQTGGAFLGQQQQRGITGGPVLVIDEVRGTIVYYGTQEQQEQLAALVKEFETDAEQIVIREYKLNYARSDDVADLLMGLLENQAPAADSSPLLPEAGGGQIANRRQTSRNRTFTNPRTNQDGTAPTGLGGDSGMMSLDAESSFVISDPANNQVLVKAPIKVQGDFEKVIRKLDLRRPQVYVEAKIVAVTATDDFRLAFEYQLINANGAGGVMNTNFGLSTFNQPGTGGGTNAFNNAKLVRTGLSGFTGAIINSDQVPIVINALKTNSDTRILSTPSLLVDDNEEAEIVSVLERQTRTTSQSQGNQQVTSVGTPVEAGTKLTVTPSISEAGSLRLKYDVELSNFVGVGTDDLPPPKEKRNVRSESVTIPSDTTIVVGGIDVSEANRTFARIPLLGDLPLIGFLFGDTSEANSKTTLYVFITPRIMTDPNFNDLRLITRGPQAVSKLAGDFPTLVPSSIEIVQLPRSLNAEAPVEGADASAGATPGAVRRREDDEGGAVGGGERR